MTANPHPHSHSHAGSNGHSGNDYSEDFERLRLFLEAHFGDVSVHAADGGDDELTMSVEIDGTSARLDLITMVRTWLALCLCVQRVDSESVELRERVDRVVEMALATTRPLALAFVGQNPGETKAELMVA